MYYIDNQQSVHATHAISAMMLRDLPAEHWTKIKERITYELSRGLRREAEDVAARMGWKHYLFVESAPHTWPDTSERAIYAAIFRPDPVLQVKAIGYVFEQPPAWTVREMQGDVDASHRWLGVLRPVATLGGERGVAIAGDGTIFYWPDRVHA